MSGPAAPKLDPARARHRWRTIKDLKFVDADLPAGTVLDEVHEEELCPFDVTLIRRKRKREDATGGRGPLVVVLFEGVPRYLTVGVDLHLETGNPKGVIRRRRIAAG